MEEIGACETKSILPRICVTVCRDDTEDVWRCRVVSASAGGKITIYQDYSRDPFLNPPVNEQEAIDAVNEMNAYQDRGKVGAWHTSAASLAHEEHHRRELEDAYKFYWKELDIQGELERNTIPCFGMSMDNAIHYMEQFAISSARELYDKVVAYILRLPDESNSRPYCAGQEVLNEATAHVIRLADTMGWSNVPRVITKPGTIEPPCFLPPVNEMYARSVAAAE